LFCSDQIRFSSFGLSDKFDAMQGLIGKGLDKNGSFVIIKLLAVTYFSWHCAVLFILTKEENKMFPEYRDLISKLKQEDAHFARLFDEHNELDDKITGLVNNPVTSGSEEIEELKKAKLKLKDELYALLQKASGK